MVGAKWLSLLPIALGMGGCARPDADPQAQGEPAVVRSAECRWTNGGIVIDGRADEGAWQRATELRHFAVFWNKRPARTETRARLLWDGQFLYFTATMDDSDLFADVDEPNGRTWENDVFELFFKPSERDRKYYEFQVNAANTPLELFLPSRGSGGYRRFAGAVRMGLESAVQRRGTLNQWEDKDQGWTVEGRIPWSAFQPSGGKPKIGDVWRFALCRYDYSSAFEEPELSSTAPLTVSNFHRYEDYGELKFTRP